MPVASVPMKLPAMVLNCELDSTLTPRPTAREMLPVVALMTLPDPSVSPPMMLSWALLRMRTPKEALPSASSPSAVRPM